MLVVLFLLNDYPDGSFTSGRFLVAQLACVCAQLAFTPLVLGPMIGHTRGNSAALSPAWVFLAVFLAVVYGAFFES
jgi:hypothetical protein